MWSMAVREIVEAVDCPALLAFGRYDYFVEPEVIRFHDEVECSVGCDADRRVDRHIAQ
ncbi:MAG: hypothetical protein ACLR8Y_19570 [Alistipes indistinctus]